MASLLAGVGQLSQLAKLCHEHFYYFRCCRWMTLVIQIPSVPPPQPVISGTLFFRVIPATHHQRQSTEHILDKYFLNYVMCPRSTCRGHNTNNCCNL